MCNAKSSVFISYSWDSDEHQDWVRKLADSLESDEHFHVLWDGYDLDSFTDKNQYMEQAVFNSDYIIVVGTKEYKDKADGRHGGVGIETYLSAIAHWKSLENDHKTKIILVLREPGSEPNYLQGHINIRFLDDNKYYESLDELKRTLKGTKLIKRPEKKRNN